MSPTFQMLNREQRAAIASAAIDLLERIGVRLTEPEAQQLLHSARARIDGDRVRIPQQLVEDAIRSAPGEITVYTRDGTPAMHLGGNSAYFGAHTDAPNVLDPYTGRRRPCLEADVARHVRLIDALPRISYTTASGLVADRPAEIGDRVSLAGCLTNSTKPVLAMPVTLQALAQSRQMAALAAGGALPDKPLLIVYAEPVSPLVHPDESIKKLLYCAEHRIPLVYSGFAAMGGTAPQSPATIVAQLCAETLSGLVVHQLKQPGAPYIFGGMASIMDMKTTIFAYGAPEFQRGNTLLAEMAHHFGLPNFGTAGTSDSQVFDGQAVMEATSSCLMATLSGADLIHDVGLLGNATVVMPEMIVASNEAIGMIEHLLGDLSLEESLVLDIVDEVGVGGEFVTHPHTLRHFRDVWYPELLYRGGARAWQDGESATFEQRVNARTRELMEEHQPPALPDDLAAEIAQIATRTVQ
ncbi:MAG: trimethylamine methyltransferase family protein [Anaerolineae bacterium]